MNFLIILAIILLLVVISEGISKILRIICLGLLMYTLYTLAIQADIIKDLIPEGSNPLLEWGSDFWNRVRGL